MTNSFSRIIAVIGIVGGCLALFLLALSACQPPSAANQTAYATARALESTEWAIEETRYYVEETQVYLGMTATWEAALSATPWPTSVRIATNFSRYIIDPCIVDGTPVIISVSADNTTRIITYQKSNGDIVTLMLERDIGGGFYLRYTDLVTSGKCAN